MRSSKNKQFIVEWDETNSIIRTKNLSYFNREQLKEMYNEIIDCGIKHNCKKVFNDARQFVSICLEDNQWVREDWFPRFVKAGFKKSAVILPSNMIQREMLEIMLQDDENLTGEGRPVEVKCFTSPDEGMAWLLS